MKALKVIGIGICCIFLCGCKNVQNNNKEKTNRGISAEKPINKGVSDTILTVSAITEGNEKKEVSVNKEECQAAKRQEMIQGKEYQFCFSEVEEAGGARVHDRNVYVDRDGVTVKYDAETGQLVSFTGIIGNNDVKEAVTEEEALQIAQEFMSGYLDLSQYELLKIVCDEYLGYEVAYTKVICGYQTTELAVTSVSRAGSIQWFSYTPYIFDGKQIDSIDETKAVQDLGKKIKEQYESRLIGYTILEKKLAVNAEGNVELRFLTQVVCSDDNGEQITEKIVLGVGVL